MDTKVADSDWKLFRERLPIWQRAWIARLEEGYMGLLQDEERSPEERFWALEKRIRQDRKSPGVEATLSRSNMLPTLCQLLEEGVIAMDDLDGMSEELVGRIQIYRSLAGNLQ